MRSTPSRGGRGCPFPDEPEVQFGLARAYAPSDGEQMGEAIDAVTALERVYSSAK